MVVGHLILLTTHLWAVKNASGGDPVTSRVLDPQGVEAGTLRFQTAMTSGRVRLKATFLQVRCH
jgi:hypothetical protein